MRILGFLIASIGISLVGSSAIAASLLWETPDFAAPESVLVAPDGTIFVSSINGDGAKKDGNGFVSKVSADGKLIKREWATGLDGPKGLALSGGKLFVADIDQLVAIDVKTGAVVARYQAPGAEFLNDVAADSEGRIYVSDTFTDTIWRLEGEDFSAWLNDARLKGPNGLLVEGKRLIVGAWGVRESGFATKEPGHLLSVSLADRSISTLGNGKPIGNLDGLEALGDGNYLVTDWLAGTMMSVTPEGSATVILELGQGSADLDFDPSKRIAVVPMMKDGVVRAYQLD